MSSHGHPGSNMAPTSWKALTSSRLTSLKDYVAQMDYKATYDSLSSRVRGIRDDGSRQTWDRWARQALRKPYGSTNVLRMASAVETVQLFPGWAVRRYKDHSRVIERGAQFGLDVYVSGFASSVRPPEAATRSQKAFYRLAKGSDNSGSDNSYPDTNSIISLTGYAALPKLAAVSGTSSQMGPAGSQIFDQPSEPDLAKNISRPTEEIELETLDAQFREISVSSSLASSSCGSNDDDDALRQKNDNSSYFLQKEEDEVFDRYTDSRSGPYRLSHHRDPITPGSDPSTPISSGTQTPLHRSTLQAELVNHAIQKLHANLDSRLQPFWSSAIPNRIIRLSIFCPHSGHVPSEAHDMMEGQGIDIEPLATQYVTTGPQGFFQATLNVPWDRLATHPPTSHVAFGDRDIEYPVVVQAEMWTPLPNSPSPAASVPSPHQRNNGSRSRPHIFSESSLAFASASAPQLVSPDSCPPAVKRRIRVLLPISQVPLRLISDIDDTIKHAGVLQGAKYVFRNVFVRHLEDLVVRSMVDWYRKLWQKGVRFHYVSNSPFELLPVLSEYFHVSSLPEGSIKLKSYAARSLLPALLSSPASRKRQGIVEVLDAFPESRFILVGDTGEQDMELYAELARERPHQVAGVFVRNVSTAPGQEYGTTGNGFLNTQSDGPLVDNEAEAIESIPSVGSLSTSSSGSTSSTTSGRSYSARSPTTPTPKPPRLFPRSRSWGALTVEEKRQYELETRITRAQAEIPKHIAFRVFREPQECVEVQSILDQFLGVGQ